METLAPPPIDPLVRSEPPFVWGVTPPEPKGGSAIDTENVTLDPDVAMWRAIIVSIWPFTGAPTTGEYPTGWLGVDATGTIYVCKVGGTPGTWDAVGGGGGGGWPSSDGTGPGNLTAATADDDTTGYNFTDNGSGGFNVTTQGDGGVDIVNTVADSSISMQNSGSAGVSISDTGANNGTIGLTTQAGSGGVAIEDDGSGGITLNNAGTGNIILTGVPTTDPAVAGALFTTAGVLHVSAG